jgi:hypothetical protein
VSEVPVEQTVAESDQVGIGSGDLNWQLPSADAIATDTLQGALLDTAARTGLDHQAVLEQLHRGDELVLSRYHYGIARHVAEFLGTMDTSIRAVYQTDYDATPGDVCFCASGPDHCVHLIVWAQRRTQAFSVLAAAVDRALTRRYVDAVGCPHLLSLLDVQVVDDAEVEGRTGIGAMLGSIHRPPLPLWERAVAR